MNPVRSWTQNCGDGPCRSPLMPKPNPGRPPRRRQPRDGGGLAMRAVAAVCLGLRPAMALPRCGRARSQPRQRPWRSRPMPCRKQTLPGQRRILPSRWNVSSRPSVTTPCFAPSGGEDDALLRSGPCATRCIARRRFLRCAARGIARDGGRRERDCPDRRGAAARRRWRAGPAWIVDTVGCDSDERARAR